jgi:Rrf2 family nitric oxide-sensitive transcriptional repressor
MRLTYQTDYAFRMLIYLALHQGQPSRVTDVALSYGISRNHLLKVALKLSKLGYVTTLRGRAGGIALGRDPGEINLGEVVRGMEDGFGLVDCMRPGGGACAISPACRLKGVVIEALDAFSSVFDSYTIADIVADRAALTALLDLGQGVGETA